MSKGPDYKNTSWFTNLYDLRKLLRRSFVSRLGSTMTGALEVQSADIPIEGECTPASPGDYCYETLTARAVKTSDMGDGFGASLAIEIEDDAAVENRIVVYQGIRNGADNSGRARIRVTEAGTWYSPASFEYDQITFDDAPLVLTDTSRVTKRVWIGAQAIGAPGANPATLGVNSNNFAVYTFADNLDKYVWFNFPVPDDMDLSADATLCVGWSTPATSGNCQWDITYLITAPGDSTEQAGTNDSGAFACDGTADALTVSTIETITGGTIQSDELCIHCILFRDGNNAADTLSNTVELHGVSFNYTANKLGT